MRQGIAILLLFSAGYHLSEAQKSSLLWREDGRCGEQFPLPNGKPGQCNPEGDGPRKGPCCSPKGFCGNTVKHCKCATCIDYSSDQFATEPEKRVTKTKPKNKETKPKLNKQPQVNDSPEKESETETVQTRAGAIKGKKIDAEGSTHFQFLGIPYAKPPVGALRFQAPVPAKPWTQTLEAYEKGPMCYQNNELLPGPATTLSEDCLHLNIYTRDMEHTAKPVMVWIHGGAFVLGSGNDYAPLPALLEEGVMVVTINYRLASLGFLTFGNDIVSGNMGLKDQALAIQWVKQNIHNFGGNPDKITIFGESAGGISVHAQVLSPWNFGQIQGAIAHSGTMLLYHQIKSYGQREETFAKNAAQKLGCDEALDQNTLRCLQNIDIEVIMEKLKESNSEAFNKKSLYEWRPVVDNYAANPFLPLDPLEAMQTGVYNHIPFMSGTVKNEGALILPTFKIAGKSINEVKEHWGSIGPLLMYSSSTYKPTQEDELLANITMKYYNHPTGDSAVEQDQAVMDIQSDCAFISPDQKTVLMMSKHSHHIFNYHLTQQTDKSFLGTIFGVGPEYTPLHGDDLIFLLEVYGQKLQLSEDEAALSKHMVKYWTNFAKFAHPTPSASEDLPYWDAVTETSHNYMKLSAVPHMEQDLLSERMHYWEKMLWEPKQQQIEKRQVYAKATQFLLGRS